MEFGGGAPVGSNTKQSVLFCHYCTLFTTTGISRQKNCHCDRILADIQESFHFVAHLSTDAFGWSKSSRQKIGRQPSRSAQLRFCRRLLLNEGQTRRRSLFHAYCIVCHWILLGLAPQSGNSDYLVDCIVVLLLYYEHRQNTVPIR